MVGINELEKHSSVDIKFMVPSELIKWCKERKTSLGISNQKLSELSGVPLGTIDRILSGSYNEFRYSSIQPLVAVLLGLNDSTPAPEDSDEDLNQYYYDTIEGYRIVVSEKNHEIDMLRRRLEDAAKEIDFLRVEVVKKQSNLEKEQSRSDWLQSLVDEMRRNGKEK